MNARMLLLSLLAWTVLDGSAIRLLTGAEPTPTPLIPARFKTDPPTPITAAACSVDNEHLVVGSQRGIEIRSIDGSKIVGRLSTKLEHVHDLKFSPDGQTLLAAGGSPAEFGAVEQWNWSTRSLIRTVSEHQDLVYRVAWSPLGTHWATAGWDAVCYVFDAESGKRQATYLGHSRPLLGIDYLPDGQLIVSAGVDQTIQLWQAATGSPVRTLSNHVNTVNDVAIGPSSSRDALPKLVSISDDRTVRVWQPTIGRLVRFAKLTVKPISVHWISPGERFVVGCQDGTVRWFDAASLKQQTQQQASQSAIVSIAVSPTDNRLTVGTASGEIVRLP